MPKPTETYESYGKYEADKDKFSENSEKEVSVFNPNSSQDVLRENEKAATKDAPESEKSEGFYKASTANKANNREIKPGDFTKAGVAARMAKGSKELKGPKKLLAPLFFIIAVTGAGAIGIGFSQVMMPFHIVETFTETTDGSFTARQARMPKLVRWIFNMEQETSNTEEIRTLLSGKTTRYRRSINSKRTIKRLAAEGIDVAEREDGKTILRYTNAKGEMIDVPAEDYQRVYREDADFRNKMNRGGRSFLGRIAAHIDLTLANFLNSHNLTKNLFKNWINKVYDAEGQTARLNKIIEARKPETTGNTRAETAGPEEEGKEPTVKGEAEIDSSMDAATMGDRYKKMLSDISGVANMATTAVCGSAAIASAVTAAKVVIAYENARGGFASKLGEPVDKTKAGFGDNSPMSTSMNTIMERDENGLTAMQNETSKWATSGMTYKPNKNAKDVNLFSIDAIYKDNIFSDIATSTSFIIGCAVVNVMTAAISVVADIASLGTFSVGRFLLGVGATVAFQEGVNLLVNQLVENAKTDFCTDVKGPAMGACLYLGASKYNGENFQSGGGSPATKEKAEGFYDAYKVALADEAELIQSTKSPFDTSTSHTFLGSIVSKLGFLSIEMPSISGVASSLYGLASSSLASLMPSAQAVEKFSYFANGLRDDCANLQFGDIQALGDLNCEPVFITDQSINSGKIADLAVTPDEVTPTGKSGIDPEYIFMILKKAGSFEYDETNPSLLKKIDKNGKVLTGADRDNKDGVEVINKDSLLGKYISNCAYRSSPFGHIDQNIMTRESQTIDTSGSALKKWLSNFVNSLPIIGEIIQATEGSKQITSVGWSTGANCVARNDSSDSAMHVSNVNEAGEPDKNGGTIEITLESWNDFMRYVQAYVSDDRFMQTASEDYISPVQLYAEKEGLVESDDELSEVAYLAKYTGYTEENMQIALNELEYWLYIAQYEPEGKGPVVAPEETLPTYNFSTPEVVPDSEVMLASSRFVVYADVRNRYATMA